jgi:hypothetical protein
LQRSEISDVALYVQATQQLIDNAKSNHASNVHQGTTIAQAEKKLQRAWDRLSASKKNALRSEQREWIKGKDAKNGDEKLAAIQERTTYLEMQ